MVCIPLNFTCLCNVSIDLILPVEVESVDQQNDYYLQVHRFLLGNSPVRMGKPCLLVLVNLFASLRMDSFC